MKKLLEKPYVSLIRTRLGEAGLMVEDISAIFQAVTEKCPEVLRDRPSAERHDNIDFKRTLTELQKSTGFTKAEVMRLVTRENPYLLFEDLEEPVVKTSARRKSFPAIKEP